MKFVIFDISGEFAHFRKFNTTSSSLTYLIPPRPTIAGMIAAIMGLGREEYYSRFTLDKAGIAVQCLSTPGKKGFGFNLVDTKKSFNRYPNRTQVKYEFISNPSYRVFFSHTDDEFLNELKSRLINKNYHFQPYLGLSQLTANATFVEVVDALFVENSNETNPIEVHSAINLKKCVGTKKILINEAHKYTSAIMPIEIVLDNADSLLAKEPKKKKKKDDSLDLFAEQVEEDPVIEYPKNRITSEFSDVIFELWGNSILAYLPNYYDCGKYGRISIL